MTPSATPKVTKEAIQKAKEVGLARWAFSLDGPTAEIHDRLEDRRVISINDECDSLFA